MTRGKAFALAFASVALTAKVATAQPGCTAAVDVHAAATGMRPDSGSPLPVDRSPTRTQPRTLSVDIPTPTSDVVTAVLSRRFGGQHSHADDFLRWLAAPPAGPHAVISFAWTHGVARRTLERALVRVRGPTAWTLLSVARAALACDLTRSGCGAADPSCNLLFLSGRTVARWVRVELGASRSSLTESMLPEELGDLIVGYLDRECSRRRPHSPRTVACGMSVQRAVGRGRLCAPAS